MSEQLGRSGGECEAVLGNPEKNDEQSAAQCAWWGVIVQRSSVGDGTPPTGKSIDCNQCGLTLSRFALTAGDGRIPDPPQSCWSPKEEAAAREFLETEHGQQMFLESAMLSAAEILDEIRRKAQRPQDL